MLKILKVVPDGHTGQIALDLCVVDGTDLGVPETFGIHPSILKNDFDGDINRWLDGIHRELLARHNDRKASLQALTALQGTILLLDEEKHGTETGSTDVQPSSDAESSG